MGSLVFIGYIRGVLLDELACGVGLLAWWHVCCRV